MQSLNDSGDREPIEALAAEYSERCRAGERVSMDEYVQRFPDLADQIRELFPAIQAIEQLNARRMEEVVSSEAVAPKQLGDYQILGEIARGGMGIVYEAQQITLGRRVAVKVLPRHALTRERDIRRFEREAQTAAKLHHSNIVPVFGVGQDDGYHFIVMQLIRGVGLDEILTETKRLVRGGPDPETMTAGRSSTAQRSALGLLQSELRGDTVVNGDRETLVSGDHQASRVGASMAPSLLRMQSVIGPEYYKNVARVGLQAAQALHYAHRHNTLHRDVKPGNLLLDAEGSVWIADFGLAKAIESDNVTNSGDVVGTLAYVAPERFQGETTERSDIYSLGLTLHEMLTLKRAFNGKDRVTVMNQVANEQLQSPRKTDARLPKDLETIVMKAASHDAADRYATAGEMALDLEEFLADRPIQARRLSKVEHAVRWCRRNRPMAAMAASVAVLIATVFGVTVGAFMHSEQQRRESDAESRLAISILDEFYTQFASGDLNVPLTGDDAVANDTVGNAPLPLSKDVVFMLERMLPFYDKFSRRAKDTHHVALKSISAISKVGDIRRRLGDLTQAQRSYEEAIRRIQDQERELPDSESVRLETARIYNGLGMVLLQQDCHNKDAAMYHREAIDVLEPEGASEHVSFELARSLYLFHDATHRHGEGSSQLNRARQILKQLEKRDPDNPKHRFLMARCLLADAPGCGNDGSLTANQAKAIEILEGLVADSPNNPEYQFELGDTFRSIEWQAHKSHRRPVRNAAQLQRSEVRLRRALEVTKNLEILHPNIVEYYVMKKRVHMMLATVLTDQDRLSEAAGQYVRAIDHQKRVISQSGNAHRHKIWLHDAELSYARLLQQQGKTDQARKLLHSLAIAVKKLAEHPETKSDDRLLAKTYLTWAGVERCLGNRDAEQQLLRKVDEIGS